MAKISFLAFSSSSIRVRTLSVQPKNGAFFITKGGVVVVGGGGGKKDSWWIYYEREMKETAIWFTDEKVVGCLWVVLCRVISLRGKMSIFFGLSLRVSIFGYTTVVVLLISLPLKITKFSLSLEFEISFGSILFFTFVNDMALLKKALWQISRGSPLVLLPIVYFIPKKHEFKWVI